MYYYCEKKIIFIFMENTPVDMAMAKRQDWQTFRVQYTHNGERVTDDAYLTIQDGDHALQAVVLPTGGYILARWNSDAPVDFERLRQRAIENVSRMQEWKGHIPDEAMNVEPIKISPFIPF